MKVAGERFTVVGAGKSGIAAANALARRGAEVLLVEAKSDRERPSDLDPRALYEAGSNAVRPGDVAVLSPGISEVSPVRGQAAAAASEVIGEVELFWRLSPTRDVLAVTGTDGKSTVTTMLGDIAKRAGRPTFVGGNLGNPLCEALDELTPEHVVVAEISAFQLTTTVGFRPKVAVVTNIAEDHLDYHGGMAPYEAAKRRIWAAMGAGDVVLLPKDDPFVRAWPLPEPPPAGPEVIWFGGDDLRRFPWIGDLPFPGRHNAMNALSATLAALAFGWAESTCREALREYRLLPHRLEPVRELDGVKWVNDSKATNPNAASAGLRAIAGPVVLLTGGSDKATDFTAFGALVRERTRAAVCFGQTREALARAIGPGHSVTVVETLAEAVQVARGLARPGDTVLLGPACASFDQFKSYGHRGEVFRRLVRDLEPAVP